METNCKIQSYLGGHRWHFNRDENWGREILANRDT